MVRVVDFAELCSRKPINNLARRVTQYNVDDEVWQEWHTLNWRMKGIEKRLASVDLPKHERLLLQSQRVSIINRKKKLKLQYDFLRNNDE